MRTFIWAWVLLFTLGSSAVSFGQDCDVSTVQPSIMVLPRTVEGEDLRKIMDEQPEVRVAVSQVKQAFDQRGFTTKDFETSLRAAMRTEEVTRENATEFKNRLFLNVPADIVVEIDPIPSMQTYGNSMTIILEANVTDNGNSMGSVTLSGRIVRTPDLVILMQSALASMSEINPDQLAIDQFLDTMNDKWAEMREIGKNLVLEFGFSNGSPLNMDSLVGGDPLKYAIEDFLEGSAYKNRYSITGVTETQIRVDEYRYPIRDPENCSNMSPRKVERTLYRFFRGLDLPVKFANSRGIIYVTIQ